MSKPSGYKKRLAEIRELKTMCAGLMSQLHFANQTPYFLANLEAAHLVEDPIYKWASDVYDGISAQPTMASLFDDPVVR